MNVTLLVRPEERRHGLKWPFFEGLHRSASKEGIRCRMVQSLTAPADLVIGWGYGSWWRDRFIRRFVMLDLGYFNRDGAKYETPVRVAFGKMHNPELVHAEWPPDRWDAHGIALRDDFDPLGHVVIVGQGRKSCQMYGEQLGEWENRKLAEIRRAFESGRRIVFRPKPGRGNFDRLGILPIAEGPIDAVMRGAALVVCRHSNVAIDALIAGVPVVCEDGLAAAVCPKTVRAGLRVPSVVDRLRVLRCAAWLNWTREEAADGSMWRWLKTQTL